MRIDPFRTIVPVFMLLTPVFAFGQAPGINAPEGCGSPLQWNAETGPWAGGYNTRCAIADFDLDGDLDIAADYALGGGGNNNYWGLHLYENLSPETSRGLPLFASPRRLSFHGHPLAYDWNRDGKTDLIVENQWYRNLGSFKFAAGKAIPNWPKGVKTIADLNSDGVPDLLTAVRLEGTFWPPKAVWHRDESPYNPLGIWKGGVMRDSLRLHFGQRKENQSLQWSNREILPAGGDPLEVYGGPDPTLADWDADGDLDLMVGAQTEIIYYENMGTARKPLFSRGRPVRVGDRYVLSGIFIRPKACKFDGDSNPDLLVAQENGDVSFLRCLGLDEHSVPSFEDEVTFDQRKPYLNAGCLSVLSVIDWDADGDRDIISGNSYGEVFLFVNRGSERKRIFASREPLCAAGEPIRIIAGPNGSIQGPGEAHFGYTCPTACDWNGDGWPDLILADIWGKHTYYQRDPETKQLKQGVPIHVKGGRVDSYTPRWVWHQPRQGELINQWRCQPAVTDWNHDEIPDLITLDSEGYLALYPGIESKGSPVVKPPQRVFLLPNGQPIRITPGVGGRAGRSRIVIADWDEDGDRDIIRGCTDAGDHEDPNYKEHERVAILYENNGDDRHFTFKGSLLKDDDDVSFCGHATSPAIVDWDADGKLDLLLGTEDGLIYYFNRTYLEGN